MISYIGCTTFEGALGTLGIITGAAAIRARKKGQRISTFIRKEDDGSRNPGAYVAEPLNGFQEDIVSFDANSLYPNLMISLNMSPETKVGKIIETTDEDVTVQHVNGQVFKLSKPKFAQFIKKEDVAISKAKVLFTQKNKGIVPEMVDFYYQKRKVIQTELKKYKKEYSNKELSSDRKLFLETKITQLNAKQQSIKIFINSCYGYFGNKHAPIGDDDIASSITLTGQAVIKQAREIAKQYISKHSNITDQKTLETVAIYGDTDSLVGDTLIETNIGILEIADLYNNYKNTEKQITSHGHEIIDVCDKNLKTFTFCSKTQKIKFGKIKNLIRHKVSKKKYKIVVNGKTVIMTEDHGCMVLRNGSLIRVSPKEIDIKTDKMISMI
jgi:DNA polymerase elongation subunit (family B)